MSLSRAVQPLTPGTAFLAPMSISVAFRVLKGQSATSELTSASRPFAAQFVAFNCGATSFARHFDMLGRTATGQQHGNEKWAAVNGPIVTGLNSIHTCNQGAFNSPLIFAEFHACGIHTYYLVGPTGLPKIHTTGCGGGVGAGLDSGKDVGGVS